MQPNELSKESIGTACWTTQVVAFDTIININMLSNNHRTAKSTDAPGQTDFVWCEKKLYEFWRMGRFHIIPYV